MAPSLALDADGLALAIGAAGGTRLRTALVSVAAGILDEGLDPQAAVDRPRVHPADGVVNAEPGADEDGLARARGVGTRRSGAGRRAITISAASARSGGLGRPPTRGGAVLCGRLGRQADRDPADVAALGAAGILSWTVPPPTGFA